MSLGEIQPPFGTTKDSITLDDYLAEHNSSPVEELNFLAPRKTISGKFVPDKKENETMSLGTKEQRTEDMKRQAMELIEQAYQRGYKAGVESRAEAVGQACEEAKNDGIMEGRNEAWEAARKIYLPACDGGLSGDEVRRIFNIEWFSSVLKTFSASEVIEKLRKHEEKKQEDTEIRVGDEITYRFKDGRTVEPFVVMKITSNECGEKYYEGLEIPAMKWVGGGLDYTKTGRHFPESVEVLKKLKEGE